MSELPIGTLMDNLGIMAELEEGDQIIDALVISRVACPDQSGTQLILSASSNQDWVVSLGMVHGALSIVTDHLRGV